MVVEVRFLFRTRDWNEISGKIRGLSIKISDLTWNLEKKIFRKSHGLDLWHVDGWSRRSTMDL
jgi:hypothetical protein